MPETHYIADDLGPEPTALEPEPPLAWTSWDWDTFAHWLEVWT